MIVSFTVEGLPKPQGSKKAIPHAATGRPILLESAGKDLKNWRYAVAQQAAHAMNGRPPMTGSCKVEIRFWMPRPKGHFGTGRNAGVIKNSAPREHLVKPDLDKLTRAVFDSLSSRVYRDDSQVTEMAVSKGYSSNSPFATIKVTGYESENDDV